MGQMHAVKTENSERHKRILNVLKAADHPLSGEEISARIQAIIGRIPQAVSTSLGEMRGERNIQDGYKVSYSAKWISVEPGKGGVKTNRDNSITFYIEGDKNPWHDGHPRYWLIAAPGWVPRWRVDKEGRILPCTDARQCGVRSSECGVNAERAEQLDSGPVTPDPSPPTCRYCKAELPLDKKDTAVFCSDDHKDAFWKKIREIGKATAGVDAQEKTAL